jgi:DNA repair photolyase
MLKEVTAKSILRKQKKIDSWFISRYGMNLYRGCAHNCVYCDGRAEKYNVEGEFGADIAVKVNAIDILRRELDPSRKRSPMAKGYVLLGGGVGDAYQPAEKRYCLARRTLELLISFNHPVHILTKSTLVERDIDLVEKINNAGRAILSMSFSSTDDAISALFEPGVPPPSKRLATLMKFKKHGIACGMFLLPVIPFITDKPEILEKSVAAAKSAELDFIVFGGMTLKDGRQRQYFEQTLKRHYPQHVHEYDIVYRGDKWGQADSQYYNSLNELFAVIAEKHGMPKRIPPKLYAGMLDDNDRVVVMLEQLDYLYKLCGNKSPFGYAAYNISRLKEPLSSMQLALGQIKGVGERTKKVVLEILETGRCKELERML